MAFKLFEFVVEQFVMDTFVLKLTQFEKTGSMGKLSILRGSLKWIPFSKLEVDRVFRDLLQFFCSITKFAFLLTNEMNWAYKISKIVPRKIEFEPKQNLKIFLKKN